MHGSKSEYLDALEALFWAAPTRTASIKGVVPISCASGAHMPGKRMRLKKMIPVIPTVIGVTAAAAPHPHFSKILRQPMTMETVRMPVMEEKLPMKALYELGSGNWAFSLDFQLTCGRVGRQAGEKEKRVAIFTELGSL